MTKSPDDPEAAAGALADALGRHAAPEPLDPERRTALRARILAAASPSERSGPAPAGTRTVRADEGEWELGYLPGIDRRVVWREEGSVTITAFYRMAPGAAIPPHDHAVTEECLVVEGTVRVGEHRVHAGDMHFADAGSRHPPLESDEGALLLIRSQPYDLPRPPTG